MNENLATRFFKGNAASYDLIVNLFTYGADSYWKRRILAKVPPSQNILDLACGTGILTFKLAGKFPGSKIVGVDLTPGYITIARKKANKLKLGNIQFVCGRAEQIRLRATFDVITSSYIPKYVSAERLIGNISENLRAGGSLVLHDFAYPDYMLFQKIWAAHMAVMKVVGTPIFPQWRTVFYELKELVCSTRWITEYSAVLEKQGFRNIRVEKLTAGSAAIVSAEKA